MFEQQRDWPQIGRRTGFIVSFVMVAGVAARVSYSHIRDVALYGHQPADVALILPFAVDGMMLIATLAMAEDKAANRKPRPWARFGFWFGAVISTVANVAATLVKNGLDPLSIGVAAAAPLFLLVAIEIVARPGKANPVVPVVAPAITEAVAQVPMPVTVAAPAAIPQPTAPVTVVETADEEPEPAAADAESPELPEAPVSPAISGERQPYGPRKGDAYSQRHDRRLRNGK